MAMPRFDLGGALIEGLQAGQADAMRRQQMRLAEEQAAFERSLRPIRQAEAQYGLRGQILGTVETPEDYRAALGEVSRLNLPTGDLPEDKRSTAWMTFKAPEPAQVAPSWLPAWAKPAPLLPAPKPSLPAGEMSQGQIAPEDIPRVQRAANRGLSIAQQAQFSDKSIGRQLQDAQIAAQLAKYAEQEKYRSTMTDLAERRFGLAETADQRKASLEQDKLDIERRRLSISEKDAARAADASAPKIPGYEPIPEATVDAASAKIARDAIGKKKSLRDIIAEFRSVYNRVKAQGPSARITGGDAQRLNAIRQRMLLNLKEAENLGVLQAVDIQTMEPLVPQAIGVGAMVRGAVGLADPEVALEQFENEVSGRLGNVIESHGYRAIQGGRKNLPTGSVDAPPVSVLKEGVGKKFPNGQVWTLRNGQAVRVK